MKKLSLIMASVILAGCVTVSCGAKTEDGVYTDVPEYTAGVFTENGYESAWSDIKFTASDSLTVASAEELAQMNAMGDGATYEMMATDDTTFDTVLVRSLPKGDMTWDEYLDVQLDSIIEEYKASGLSVDCKELEDRSFGGKSYKGTLYTVGVEGTSIYQCVYRALLGDLVSEVYFTYSEDAAFETLISCFGE